MEVRILDSILDLAERDRPGYRESMQPGVSQREWPAEMLHLPQLVAVYSHIAGTHRTCPDQRMLDFLPGYRIIHIDEIANEAALVRTSRPEVGLRIPFLADYGGGYYLAHPTDGGVDHLDPELGLANVSRSLEAFLATVHECYVSGAYSTDSDGYLDYDAEATFRIGAAMNPGCSFWSS